MDQIKETPLYPEESHAIIGCALAVHQEVGHGFYEKPYENALVIEFAEQNIPYVQQRQYDLCYKNQKIGLFIPDLIAYDKIIVDTKVIDKITKYEVGQMINYLKVTGLRLGYIINFKHAKLEWKRVVK
ncbi:MAG: GxxExxY protein [Verrucomicrobia bacterium]|nr:GxxExxY protein [Verrucomicrobiota bacterium]MCH8513373.1 GxxExxY protein [Kiritimatiellia bacterium]